MNRLFAYLLVFTVGPIAFASGGADHGGMPTNAMYIGAMTQATGPLLEGIYKVDEDTPIIPRALVTGGKYSENETFETFMMYKHQPFALRFEKNNALLTPIVPADARGSVPETYIFKRKDLAETGLVYVMDGDETKLYQTFTEYADTEVAAGHCKALVERHFGFHAGSLCASSLTSGVLMRVGFHETSCGNAQMQVWSSKRRGCGHVAWRAGNSWSSGDFRGDPGQRFRSTGCYSR
ncbi:MAG: hypothetical protein ACXVA9_03270 [Bdellovibrionales bacterium]